MAARRVARSRAACSIGVASLGAALVALAPDPAAGQTFMLDPVDRTAFSLQLEKPFLPGADEFSFYSSNFELDGVVPLGRGKSLQLGVPLAIAAVDGVDGTSAYLGNVRASLLFGEPGDLSGYLGVTVPTASNVSGPDLAVLMMALPWLNEPEKWEIDMFSVRGAWVPSKALDNGGQVGLRLGGSTLVPDELDNMFVFARVAGWGRLPIGTSELMADLGTSYNVNGDDGFGDQFTAYLDVGLRLSAQSGLPTFFIRVPLDGNARDALDLSVGTSVIF